MGERMRENGMKGSALCAFAKYFGESAALLGLLVVYFAILFFIIIPIVALAFAMGGLWWGVGISFAIIPPSYFFIKDAVKDIRNNVAVAEFFIRLFRLRQCEVRR
jgi:hypothetical protein